MHARMTAVTIPTDGADQAIALYREKVVAASREMGATGAVLLINRETGEGMSFTLWSDEAAMNASEESANQLRGSINQEIGATGTPRVERYEVAVLEMDTQ
jgi:heme-degrading monooxygenase HmoA